MLAIGMMGLMAPQSKTGKGPQSKMAKAMAAKSKEYESGDITTKRMILAKVQQYGVKQCNWVHTMDKKTVIFKIEGIDETGLDEDVKKELFEELLTARLFGITKTEESLGSQCAGMKNLQLKDPALQPSESLARAKELLKKIVAEKKRLTQSNEELKSLKTKISTKHSGGKTWDNRKDDVDQAITSLEDFLGVLRQHKAANHDEGSKALLKKVHGLME
ncbi:unnamed protein product [Symbiodinium sp. KB8]|nr:unnamed protein product [Symbiodinium sp. KB8]